jgi:hypothetical protein
VGGQEIIARGRRKLKKNPELKQQVAGSCDLYCTMNNTSLTLTSADKELYYQLRALTGLADCEFVFRVVYFAARKLQGCMVDRAVVAYQQKSVGYARLYLSVIPWQWQAVAALRNSTYTSVSCLLSMGLRILKDNPALLKTEIQDEKLEEYPIGTERLFTQRKFSNRKMKKVVYFVPFFPMYRKKGRHKYR